MEDTAYSRLTTQIFKLTRKETQLHSDIYFLSHCKKRRLIPKGLRIKNPVATTHNSQYAQDLCQRTSKKRRNHLIHLLYRKIQDIQNTKTSLLQLLQEQDQHMAKQVGMDMQNFHNHQIRDLFMKKNKKLGKLSQNFYKHQTERNIRITTNNRRTETTNGPTTTPDINTDNSGIINISDYELSKPERSVLSKGLSFCPSTKLHDIKLYSDLEEFFRRLRLKEFFHDKGDTTTTTLDYNIKKKNSHFTPAPGRNSKLDSYISSFRLRTASLVTKHHHNT
ncbi:uncharacterized protein LOC130363151 [Hyla sarda]|uniref:uncharacterized protein LOC130363151 n=1 Tax=Hyla sarda TaxID=327740 RepID=UPI0024C2C619|nr:uncharacterized protein LOC130363151 [Hyla sarda]